MEYRKLNYIKNEVNRAAQQLIA